jgi:hypothetical protein
MPGTTTVRGRSATRHDFRPNFITWTTDPYATMHYEFARWRSGSRPKPFDPPPQDPSCRAPPAGMKQRNTPPGRKEVDRNAVGYSDGEKNAWRGTDPAIDAIDVDPASPRAQVHQLDAVNLVPQGHHVEAVHAAPERQPATHDLAHRLPAPEAEVEPPSRLGAPSRDPGHDPILLAPAGNLKTRNRPRQGNLGDFVARL